MPIVTWPILWILFMVGMWLAFGYVAMQEARVRAKAAKELLASQQAMAAANAEMSPPEGAGNEGFNDGFDEAGQGEFAAFDENAFK